jgi:glycosyltransferase involved in cell wall biosynthesis
VAYLPNGVDLHRFHPATQKHKRHLRRRYGLDEERPTVLHVGHLEPARNLSALAPLSKAGMQVVVAGSLYMGTDHRLITHLEQAGYCLFKGYQPRVEDLYMLADCYAFPPAPGDSLTMPLSVLEAMACNLPVATTRFRGLTEIFRENASFRYVEAPSRIPHAVEALLASQGPRTTRYMVQPFAWMSIAERLQGYYHQALAA